MFHWLPYLPFIKVFGYWVPIVSIFFNLAVIVTLLVALVETRRLKLNWSVTVFIVLFFFIFKEIMDRGLYVLSQIILHGGLSNPNLWNVNNMKQVSIGGFIELALAVFLGTRLLGAKEKLARYADIFSLAAAAHLLLIRVGAVLAHYHPGRITDSFWGIYYLNAYRHEPSFYEALSLFVLLMIAVLVRTKIKQGGLLSLFVLSWMSFSRVITDFSRSVDLPSSNFHFANGYTLNQIVYFFLFLVSIWGTTWLLRRNRSYQMEVNYNDNR